MAKGYPLTKEQKQHLSKFFKGRRLSEETKRKMSQTRKGRSATWLKGKKRDPTAVQKGVESRRGYRHSEETKRKIGLANSREKNAGWKGGITPFRVKIWFSPEYKAWRKAVFERDRYTCVIGGEKHGSKLEADHIKSFANFPKLRFKVKNGRTLCKSCHEKTENYGGKAHRLKVKRK